MKKYTFTAAFLVYTFMVFGQTGIFQCLPVDDKSMPELEKSIARYQLYEINGEAISYYLKSANYAGVIRLRLGVEYDWVIELEEHPLFSPGYELRVADGNKITVYTGRPNIAYRGWLTGPKGGEVRLTIRGNFIYGFITQGDEVYFIEPVSKYDKTMPPGRFVVYKASDVIEKEDLTCGVTDAQYTGAGKTPAGASKVLACKEVELASASDHLMYQKFNNNIDALEAYIVGVINNVDGDYASSFSDVVSFVLTEFYISTSAGADPVSTAILDAGTVLSSFRTWGNGGGFGNDYDLAQFWTDRDFTGSTIGIAYVDVMCMATCPGTSCWAYQAIQDYATTNACIMRVLVSHETGHNFSAVHDGTGGFIMSPSVSCTSTWSSASITAINSVLGGTCLELCSTVYRAPVANFSVSTTTVCNGVAVAFTDVSTNEPSSWSWTFTGGSPSSSASQNPSVTYSTNGNYTIALTATNSMGSNATSKTNYLQVVNAPAATTSPDDASSGTLGILAVRLNGMLYFSGSAATEGSYEDFSCAAVAQLAASTAYSLYATVGDCNSSSFEGVAAWADYNGDGDFNDTGESLGNTSPSAYCGEISPITFTTPASPATNTILRMRVISDESAIPSGPLYDPVQGQSEDYGVYISAPLPIELTAFSAQKDGPSARLTWATASELNNDYFTLERSAVGVEFEAVARIPGAGTSLEERQYEWRDEHPLPGDNYYRLRQTDYDGNTTLSKVEVVAFEDAPEAFGIYPNPAGNGSANLYFTTPTETIGAGVKIFDTSGNIVSAFIRDISPGQNKISLPSDGFPDGIYLVQIIYSRGVKTLRFVKGGDLQH